MVKTRFAPSPTGYLHIGGARTALFSWLYARRHGSPFVLRVEDTDLERSTEESVNAILEGMNWLGLDYDEGPFYQTDRFDRYKEVIQQLMDQGHAYHCYCSRERLEKLRADQYSAKEKPRYDRHCLNSAEPPPEGVSPVVRFKNPDSGNVVIKDLVRGDITISNEELDDLIIARSEGTPTYNLCVVVDDMDMGITHVIRGDDHINNTPRQINILAALNAPLPHYGHVPMILGGDGKRLSKRHGAVGVMQYRADGFLPEAVVNYLVRLGWSHGDQEVFSLDEMTQLFELEDINKAASTFNLDKLLWLNQHYIKTSDPNHVARHLSWHMGQLNIDPTTGPALADVVVNHAERAKTLVEMAESIIFYYRDFEEFEEKAAKKTLKAGAIEPLKALAEIYKNLPEWEAEPIHEAIQQVAEKLEVGMGKVAQPLRVAITGTGVSPPIDATVKLLGREKTLQRIEKALQFIAAKIDA